MKSRTSTLLLGLLSSPVKSFSSSTSSSSRRAFAKAATSYSTTLTTAMTTSSNKSPTTSTTDNSGQTAKLWDRFAEGYSKKPIADEASYRKKLQITQRYLKPHMDVLEVGCGTGGTSIVHAPHVRRIVAADISPKMIDIARQRAADAGVTNVEFRRASIDELDIPDGSQDVVLGLSVLHLLKNREDAMKRVHKWLKPGGLFVTSTVCAGDMGTTTRVLLKTVMPAAQFFGLLPNFYSFTKDELKQSFEDTGFGIEREWQPPDKPDAAVFIIGKKEGKMK